MQKEKIAAYWPLWIILGCLVFVAVAGYWIESNRVTIHVSGATMKLTADNEYPYLYQNVTFTANLTRNGSPVQGATVLLFVDGVEVDSGVTDSAGLCFFVQNMTVAGDFEYYGRYWVS